MEVIILLLVAYAVSAPDPVTLAATRGAVGAGRAAWAHRASTRPARRSSARASTGAGSSGRGSASGGGSGPSSSRPSAGGRASTGSGGASTPTDTGPVEESTPTDTTASTTPSARFAGVRAAWSGARAGAGTARARRAAGVDWTSRAARTARTVALATAGAGVAAARAVGVGAGAVRARWATRTTPTTTPAPAAAGAVLVGEVIDPADPADHPAAAGTGSPVADTVAGTAGDVQYLPAPTGAGSETDVKEFLAMMQTTDLESLPEVRAEITAATTLCEELAEQIAYVQKWAEGLADRWSGTAWGTRDLDTAVADVSEAVSSLSSGEGVMEALSAAQGAVERAEQLGEVVAEHGATGDTRAFAPA